MSFFLPAAVGAERSPPLLRSACQVCACGTVCAPSACVSRLHEQRAPAFCLPQLCMQALYVHMSYCVQDALTGRTVVTSSCATFAIKAACLYRRRVCAGVFYTPRGR